MGCNCKKSDIKSDVISQEKKPLKKLIGGMLMKIILFLLIIISLPIINIAIIVITFRTLLMNKEIDMKKVLDYLGEKMKSKESNEYEYEYNELTENDVFMTGVDKI